MGLNMQIQIGDKILDIDRFENGIPVIKCLSEVIKHEDGSQDCIVNVPCLNLSDKQGNIGG
jgi:hypothetical protein